MKPSPTILGLPTVHLTVPDVDDLNYDTKIVGSVIIANAYASPYEAANLFSGINDLRYAGNSSVAEDKKPFNLTTFSGGTTKDDYPLLGMPSGRDWRLGSEVFDLTLLRNPFAYALQAALQVPWGVQTRACEVWLNGTAMGTYNLTERITRHANRVFPDGNGSFLVELVMDFQEDPTDFFMHTTTTNAYTTPPFAIDTPRSLLVEYPASGSAGATLAQTFLNGFETALAAENWATLWGTYVDFDAAVNFYIFNEIVYSIDATSHGMRLVRDVTNSIRGGKMFFTSWDHDAGQGLYNGGPVSHVGLHMANQPWFTGFLQDPDFVAAVKARFAEVLPLVFHLLREDDANAAVLTATGAYARNFALWGADGWSFSGYPAISSEEQQEYRADWLRRRIAWLRTQWITETLVARNVIVTPDSFEDFLLSLSPALWLDASDASTLYNATAGGSLVAADGAVKRWQDKSGNNRHATENTNPPILKVGLINGNNALRFDGTKLLRTTSFAHSVPLTLFVATKSRSVNQTLYSRVVEHGTNSGVGIVYFTATNAALTAQYGVGVIDFGDHAETDLKIHMLRVDSDSPRNGTWQINGGIVRGFTSTNTPTTPSEFGICCTANGANFANQEMCEIIYIPTFQADAYTDLILAYLTAKWGE